MNIVDVGIDFSDKLLKCLPLSNQSGPSTIEGIILVLGFCPTSSVKSSVRFTKRSASIDGDWYLQDSKYVLILGVLIIMEVLGRVIA